MIDKYALSEVKILSIPRIAISHEDDENSRIIRSHAKINNVSSTGSSPFKPIIKRHSSQTQSRSSSTSQSYHTCPSRYDSTRRDQIDFWNNRKKEVDFFDSLSNRMPTSSSMNKPLHHYLCRRKNRSDTAIYHEQRANVSMQIPLRRTKSCYAILSSKGSNENHVKLIHTTGRRRPTVETVSHLSTQTEASSIYETPKHHENIRISDQSIRLVIHTDIEPTTAINDRSDMQVNQNFQTREQVIEDIGVNETIFKIFYI